MSRLVSLTIFSISLAASLLACTNASSKSDHQHKFLKEQVGHEKMGKTRGYFHINIERNDQDSTELNLVANIKALKAFENVTVEWKLPEKVKRIGEQQDQNITFKAGEEKQVSLSVDPSHLQNDDQIFLFVYQLINGERHGASQSFIYQTNSSEDSELRQMEQKTRQKEKIIE